MGCAAEPSVAINGSEFPISPGTCLPMERVRLGAEAVLEKRGGG
jgi:hypothetical protein